MLLNKHENDDIHTLHCTIHNQHIYEPMHCSVSDIRSAFVSSRNSQSAWRTCGT